MRRAGWLLAGLVLLGVALRAADDAKTRETAAGAALRGFWEALARGDREGCRALVDLPLTLQELKPDGTVGERFVAGEQTWARWERLFPAKPDETAPRVRLDALRLEFLGNQLCEAAYTVVWEEEPPAGAREPRQTSQRHTSLLVQRDGGWRVAVSTLPG